MHWESKTIVCVISSNHTHGLGNRGKNWELLTILPSDPHYDLIMPSLLAHVLKA